MAKIEVNTVLQRLIGGITYTTKVKQNVSIRLKDLAFEPGQGDRNRVIFTPANPGAAKDLYGIFPPEEFTYTYYTHPGYFRQGEKSRPYLYLDIRNREKPDHPQAVCTSQEYETIDIWELTEEDYGYLRGLYIKSIPGARVMTAEEYITDSLDQELIAPGTKDNPAGNGLDDLLRMLPSGDYLAVRDLFYRRRKEYTEKDSLEFDYKKLYAVFNEEILRALLERAKKEAEHE